VARPNWEYIRVDVLLPDNHKLDGLHPAAKWTLIELWCHCGQHLTDGYVRDAVWRKIGTANARRQLIEHNLAERVDGGYQMHDYLQHQRSRAEVEELKKKRAEAGRKGGNAKASGKQVLQQTLEQELQQTASKPVAEAEADRSLVDVVNLSNGSKPPALDELIMNEVHKATGRHITSEWADKIAGHLLAGRAPADPAAYIRQCIRNDPNPAKRFLPLY
jgi:hypothetical protein